MDKLDTSSFQVINIDNENHTVEFEDAMMYLVVKIKTQPKNISKVTITEPYRAVIKYVDGTSETLEILSMTD
jgi:hypothetical protein